MKKLFIFLSAIALSFSALAQSDYPQYRDINHQVNPQVRYKLYPTFNVWTYLKLDTQKGTVYQVQYSKKEGQSFELYVGTPGYFGFSTDTINGRYELYPTTNNWTFMMLDQIDGDVYEVQWGQEAKYRYIKEIK